MNYPEIALKLLKARGYRQTRPRELVLEILDKANVSLSPYEIRDIRDELKKLGEKGDVVSIYRTLQNKDKTKKTDKEENKDKDKEGDVVSIYRILQTFEENGIVHRVISSGKFRKCHLSDDMDSHSTHNHCHHNLVCRSCSNIEEINCQGMNLIEQVVSSQSMFEIESHALEFYGICKNCKSLS
jgi:Fur family ferric uptake transcriptional regulator